MAILGWALFGVGVRFWQLGLEMRPYIARNNSMLGYPIFASISGALGYYLEGVEDRQIKLLEERKQRLLEKRKRVAEAEAKEGGATLAVM